MDLVEGVAQREALDGVGDVAVEHADAADGGVVRHAHLHTVTVTAAPPSCCCSAAHPTQLVVGHHRDLPRAPRAVAVGRVPDTHTK